MWGDMVSGPRRPRRPAARRRDGLRVGLRRLVSLRRALRRAGPGGRAVLGRAGDLELAQHPREAHQRADHLPPGRGRRAGPRRARATSTPTGATTATCSSGWSASPGLAFGAAVSWCLSANDDLDMAAALSAHVFEDPDRRTGRRRRGPGRRPPAGHAAVSQHVDARDEPLLPATPRRPRPDRKADRRRARRGGRLLRRRPRRRGRCRARLATTARCLVDEVRFSIDLVCAAGPRRPGPAARRRLDRLGPGGRAGATRCRRSTP